MPDRVPLNTNSRNTPSAKALIDDVHPVLFTRRMTANILGCSTMTVMRLESKGVLKKIRLSKGAMNCKIYHHADNVFAVARGDVDGGGDAA